MFDLPPPIYNALQRAVHGDHQKQRSLIEAFHGGRDGMVLEVGCGTGLLSRFFKPGDYVGVDIDAGRVAKARELHPHYAFEVKDVTRDCAGFLQQFDVVFCSNVIHHIDDEGVKRLLANVRAASVARGRPIQLLLMEPILPRRILLNLPGYLLAKLDRGRHVRTLDDMLKLFSAGLQRFQEVKPEWYWPVPGVVIELLIAN